MFEIPFEVNVVRKRPDGDGEDDGDTDAGYNANVIFSGNMVCNQYEINVWNFKNDIWDFILNSTEDLDFKARPMSMYLARFIITCTVFGREEPRGQVGLYIGELDQDLLNMAADIYIHSSNTNNKLNDCKVRLQKNKILTVEFHGFDKSTDIPTETKVKITVEIPNGQESQKYFWPDFPTVFPKPKQRYAETFPMKALRELEMTELSAKIRRQSSWFLDIKNAETTERWKAQAKAQGLTENQVSYVIEELDYYESLRDPLTGIEVSTVDCIWHSDTLIENDLKIELLSGVATLESLPEWQRVLRFDFNNTVRNLALVDPSLYPIIYGKSMSVSEGIVREKATSCCGGGNQVVGIEPMSINQPGMVDDHDKSASLKFCWLPTDCMVRKDGSVRFDSYINNLHPVHHASLYDTLEKIFTKFLPLFERVLTDQVFNLNQESRRVKAENWLRDEKKPDFGFDDLDEDDEDAEDRYDLGRLNEMYLDWLETRTIGLPDAEKQFERPKPIPVSKKINLLGTKFQVIVKLANIFLPPGSLGYPGGVWLPDGMRKENIVATGIYYYSVSNISECELSFRFSATEPEHENFDLRGPAEVFGINRIDSLSQKLGSVQTPEGRCLVYPNAFEHRVEPFKLTDASKEGHRKILVFYLVDPGIEVTSTRTVPPQQFEWFNEELLKISFFSSLPPEIYEYFLKYVDWPMTLNEANVMREELLQERKLFISRNNWVRVPEPFSVCEH